MHYEWGPENGSKSNECIISFNRFLLSIIINLVQQLKKGGKNKKNKNEGGPHHIFIITIQQQQRHIRLTTTLKNHSHVQL